MLEKKLIAILFISFSIKVLIGGFLPLSPDEAYYWIWSHNLQLSYFDHPPFVSWLFLAGQPLESWASFVRFPGMLLSHLSILLWVLLLQDYLSKKQLFVFTLLAVLMPFFGPAGLIITPDTPMMFFWSACLLCMNRLLKSKNPWMAVLLGTCFGLGFCSKYPIVLVLPILLFWLYRSEGFQRRSLQWIFLGAGAAIVTSFPVWYWNLTNDLQSFGFQLNHGFGGNFQSKYLIHYLGGQLGLLFPAIVYFSWKSRQQTPDWLKFAAIFPLAFFAVSSLFSYAEANWPIAAHPAFLAMACFSISESRWKWVTAATWAIALTIIVSEAFIPWLPIKETKLKTQVLHKYDMVADRVKNLSPVFTRTYQMASILSFTNKTMVYKLKGMNRVDFFDFLKPSMPVTDDFYLVLKTNEKLPKHLSNKYEILRREPIDKYFDLTMIKKVHP